MKNVSILTAAALVSLAAALSSCVATVAVPPPAAQIEVRPALPFYGAIWIDGYYEHSRGRYIWMPGRYVKPPHSGATWNRGRWQHHDRGWRWHRGHWR